MELSDVDSLRLTVRGMGTLAEMRAYLMARKMGELEMIAVEAHVSGRLASTKIGVADQIIAKFTSDEEVVPEAPIGTSDEASSDHGVLPEEVRSVGVSLPAKVAATLPEQLWPQILGWEIDQGLDESARAAFTTDQLREYLGYLWHMGQMGRAPRAWARITEYEFRGLA